MTGRKFTIKQQRFIDAYNGNIKEAAEKAGLSYDYCRRLVTKSHILEAIKKRQDTETRPKLIAKRQQRQEFWTTVMDDTTRTMANRLRASELLGRSESDFTENANNKVVPAPAPKTFAIGELGLPFEVLKQILDAMRRTEQIKSKTASNAPISDVP